MDKWIGALSPMAAASIAAFITAFAVFAFCILAAYEIILIVCYWKLFNKAGDKGWKAIIPFYNEYVRCKLTWSTVFFWLSIAFGVIIGIGTTVVNNSSAGTASAPELILLMVCSALAICITVFRFIANYRLAVSYGKGGGFAAVLIITSFFMLDWIPMLVLAFGKSKYQGNVYLKKKAGK